METSYFIDYRVNKDTYANNRRKLKISFNKLKGSAY